MLSVYTGKGKGKTTAAIGAVIRALGAGEKVLTCQFLKTGNSSEFEILDTLDGLKAKAFGREGFYLPEEQLEENPKLKEKAEPLSSADRKKAKAGFKWAKENLENSEFDLVVLDEINIAVDFELLNVKEVLALVAEHQDVDFIFTGRQAPEQFLSRADLVTECKDKKHYYHQGKQSEEGREF